MPDIGVLNLASLMQNFLLLNKFQARIVGHPLKGRIVFLHGLMGYLNNWLSVTRAFESEYEILTYDQRGHGKSVKNLVGYHPSDYATDLLEIVDHLGWRKFHLVGHSMGGRNAIHFASENPSRIEKLVVEDIGPSARPEAIQGIIGILDKVPTPFKSRDTMNSFFEKGVFEPTLNAYLKSNIEQKEGDQYDWRFERGAILESVTKGRTESSWEQWKAIQNPTLVIRGELSDELSLGEYQEMLAAAPLCIGVEIPGAAHWVHFDKPKEFIATLQNFFEGTLSASPTK